MIYRSEENRKDYFPAILGNGQTAKGTKFRFEEAANGGYYIKSTVSGKYINANAGKTDISFDAEPKSAWTVGQLSKSDAYVYFTIGDSKYLNNHQGGEDNLRLATHNPIAQNNKCSLWTLHEYADENAGEGEDDDDDDDNDFSSFRSLFDDRPNFADKIQVHTGNGFADVAGLNDVKEVLTREVLFVLKNPDKAKRYRLKMLNGMMLYGPPGCGKTFIAQKFAEEAGIGFIETKASDLGSEYIHATQCNIARLFDDAASKAPTILFIDEFDSMVPHRSSTHNASLSSEVNEFLTQLNNCAERGIFVITASNFPERIDNAVLRTGRIDKMVYIPAPDAQARREVFRISLLEREQEPNIDLDLLATRSEGLVASDIAFVVNQSALDAAIEDKMISQEHILNRLQKQRRSVSEDDIQYYESLRHRLETTIQPTRRAIGF